MNRHVDYNLIWCGIMSTIIEYSHSNRLKAWIAQVRPVADAGTSTDACCQADSLFGESPQTITFSGP
jgi:hypothetical protein